MEIGTPLLFPRRQIRRFALFASRHASPCICTHGYTCAESGGSWRASEAGEEAHDGRTRGAKSGRRGARRQSDSESVDSGVAQQVISIGRSFTDSTSEAT